jgi:hypothetical protein
MASYGSIQLDLPILFCSYNEWDPLKEVIVGRVDGATIRASHIAVTFNLPQVGRKLYALVGGWRYPSWMRRLAQRELDGFIELLESEGVKVRQPDVVDFPTPTRPKGDREGTARDDDGSGSGLANFLRMRCRLEGAVSVLGLGLATIWLNSGGRAWRRAPAFKAAPVCFFAGPGDGNPWVI